MENFGDGMDVGPDNGIGEGLNDVGEGPDEVGPAVDGLADGVV